MRAGGTVAGGAEGRCVKTCIETPAWGTSKVTWYTRPAAEQGWGEHRGQHFPGTRTTVSSLIARKGAIHQKETLIKSTKVGTFYS